MLIVGLKLDRLISLASEESLTRKHDNLANVEGACRGRAGRTKGL